MTTVNPFKNTRVEFHILQSFPVTCLNRDDVGAPKTAVVGGVTRARVSSQCWKRQVRLAMQDCESVGLGIRTKRVHSLILAACVDLCQQKQIIMNEVIEKNIDDLGMYVSKIIDDKSKVDEKTGEYKTSTLVFLSNSDAYRIAQDMIGYDFSMSKVGDELEKLKLQLKAAKKDKNETEIQNLNSQVGRLDQLKSVTGILVDFNAIHDGFDIALFGRMVANAASMNVEAAASFAHAISTHKVANEVEFFTALDDRADEPGSAHMGSLEFNSATYYRYVSLDLGQLFQTLQDETAIKPAIEAFVKALYVAVPSARQTTQSGASPWEFARIYVRQGQRLQVPFETAVKSKDGGYLQASIDELKSYLDKKEKLSGSLFGKKAMIEFGDETGPSIDGVIEQISAKIG